MSAGVPWTAAEELIVRSIYRERGAKACAELLPGRSESAIVNRARALGLQRRKPGWLAKELALLQREYPIGGLAGCAAVLPGRTAQAIYQQAHNLGMTAPPVPTLKAAVGEAARLRFEIENLRERLSAAEARTRDARLRASRLEADLAFERSRRAAA